ncbi:phosphatidylinositol N-acetylglucosaminyltransferase subunit H, putative [Plasmodium reichenowi]|uniref:Phosphatidylinositol N-acetylglucosaminyltransferase subunit H, putative n=1 Tax=Plasmodium reichenowi TaxID=5854 RepID=A0A060RVC8_PLARE|nr:phosphatidylinositol N-acetylglucosaminyltransferase subunit H, putative [Plasmodium reichenowi]
MKNDVKKDVKDDVKSDVKDDVKSDVKDDDIKNDDINCVKYHIKNKIRRYEHLYGIEYIYEKKKNRMFFLFVLIFFSLFILYYFYLGYIRGYLSVNEFHIFLFILYIFCIVVYFNNIFTEKLLLLKNIGIQIDKKDSFENYTKFICKNEIENIFINEAIYMFEVCPYLCIKLKNNDSVILFKDVVLGMNNMVSIYRDIKKIFFYNDNNILKSIKITHVKNDKGIYEIGQTDGEEEGEISDSVSYNVSEPTSNHTSDKISDDISDQTDNFEEDEEVKKVIQKKYNYTKNKNYDNINLEDNTYATNNCSSSEENIFKLLNFSSYENIKINKRSKKLRKNNSYDVYINKQLAIKIMNN